MKIAIRHEGHLKDLVQQRPCFAPLLEAHIAEPAGHSFTRDHGMSSSRDLQIAFLGKSGFGKSSLVNTLIGQSVMETSDVAACTRAVQSAEYLIKPGHYLSLADLPGVGENRMRDQEYLPMYDRMLKNSDIIAYVLRADCRDYSVDEVAFQRLFSDSNKRRKVILVLNGCDKIEPVNRRELQPCPMQLKHIMQKCDVLAHLFPNVSTLVPCSAATGWQMDVLAKAIVDKLVQTSGVSVRNTRCA